MIRRLPIEPTILTMSVVDLLGSTRLLPMRARGFGRDVAGVWRLD
jgi:hypothetical protein